MRYWFNLSFDVFANLIFDENGKRKDKLNDYYFDKRDCEKRKLFKIHLHGKNRI